MRKHAPRTPDRSSHILQLFDTDESMAHCVATFLADGDAQQQTLVVIATQAHWDAVTEALHATTFRPRQAIAAGRLAVFDADDLLSRFMRRGEPDPVLFAQTVGALVARVSSESGPNLRMYGEMVELLARDGNYVGACHLEQLWNELGAAHPFTLLCGYSAAHFAAPGAGSMLTAICGHHSKVVSHGRDPLGHFLLTAEKARRTAPPRQS